MLSPSYLRRPDSYDRLGSFRSKHSQRFLANRLLITATGTHAGQYILHVISRIMGLARPSLRLSRLNSIAKTTRNLS